MKISLVLNLFIPLNRKCSKCFASKKQKAKEIFFCSISLSLSCLTWASNMSYERSCKWHGTDITILPDLGFNPGKLLGEECTWSQLMCPPRASCDIDKVRLCCCFIHYTMNVLAYFEDPVINLWLWPYLKIYFHTCPYPLHSSLHIISEISTEWKCNF